MSDPTRRQVLQLTSALGATAALPLALAADEPQAPGKSEKERVMQVGMTEAEADCWLAIADAAGKFFQLPKLHPMDAQEVASAIHIVQNKLLGRPTYRRYLELSKAAAKNAATPPEKK